MAYGIHVENPSGQVQIDQDYTNYYEVATTSFAVTYTSNYFDFVEGSLTISGYTPNAADIIAINTGHQYNLGAVYINSSNQVRYIMWANGASATVNVKIFRRLDTLSASGSGYGIEVYKANGTTLAFSSAYKPMRIAAILSGNPSFNASSIGHSGYTPYITSNTGFVLAAADPPDGPFAGITEYQTVSANSTAAYTDFSEMSGAFSPASYFYDGTVSMLVIKG